MKTERDEWLDNWFKNHPGSRDILSNGGPGDPAWVKLCNEIYYDCANQIKSPKQTAIKIPKEKSFDERMASLDHNSTVHDFTTQDFQFEHWFNRMLEIQSSNGGTWNGRYHPNPNPIHAAIDSELDRLRLGHNPIHHRGFLHG